MQYKKATQKRINNRKNRTYIDVNTHLEHFAIISYKVPLQKIQHCIPKPFQLWTFNDNGVTYALISAVAFKDKDFSFHRISKLLHFDFFQTNFRTYIIDQRDQSHAAWFFGTTLGSIFSILPEKLWGMPWKYGVYDFKYQLNKGQYQEYKMHFKSKQGAGKISIKNSGNEMQLLEGFTSLNEQIHILTHPVMGYYQLPKEKIGVYEIWHPKIDLKEGLAQELYFELFEKLGFLSPSEMHKPHSVLISPNIEFDILLPPRVM